MHNGDQFNICTSISVIRKMSNLGLVYLLGFCVDDNKDWNYNTRFVFEIELSSIA